MIELNDNYKMSSPMLVFASWFEAAQKTSLKHPEAFVLATPRAANMADEPKGSPLSDFHSAISDTRVVLMKEYDDNGLIFYSNYNSQKGAEIRSTSLATAHFYWDPLFLQVKIIGELQQTSREKSESYWQTRPRNSQLGQWVSKQSQPVTSREQMDAELFAAEKEFAGKDIPCPAHWGGYSLTPTYVEFWIGRDGRFHDRFTYLKVENAWVGQRLYP